MDRGNGTDAGEFPSRPEKGVAKQRTGENIARIRSASRRFQFRRRFRGSNARRERSLNLVGVRNSARERRCSFRA